MRCKRHTVDSTSTIGVCASCLRERLFPLAASTAASEDNDQRSVSPCLADRSGGDSSGYSNSRIFATTQVVDYSTGGRGSSSSSEKIFQTNRSFKNKQTGLSRFSTLFRTRSNDFSSPPDSPSSSWFSKVLPKKQSTCYIEDLIASESNHQQPPRHSYCKGMSPANGLESVEESPGRARRTPATGTPGRRRKTVTMGMCLSPLVRAKPNFNGEMKSPVKPHISTAAFFYANRSKKLADLGRAAHRR